MRIGIDLDNTLVCYDQLFWQLAVDRGWISSQIPARKERVRDELRKMGREADWTRLQGEVYGPRMSDAVPFLNAITMIHGFHQRHWFARVISHRTKTPIAGPPADLHEAARTWLSEQGFLDSQSTGLNVESIFLETSKADKLARIGSLNLDYFIDDLPELLQEPTFPEGVRRILFDPHHHRPPVPESIRIVHDLGEIVSLIAREACQ